MSTDDHAHDHKVNNKEDTQNYWIPARNHVPCRAPLLRSWADREFSLADHGGVEDGPGGVAGVEEDADAVGFVPRRHVGARRHHLDRHVGPVAVDLRHRRRRRPPHHLRPRRLLGAHSP